MQSNLPQYESSWGTAVYGSSFGNSALLGAAVAVGMLFQGGSAAAQTIGPNLNLTKASGNQYETSVAINPNNNNQIFIVARNEVGGLYTARTSDGGLNWTTQLAATKTAPQP